MNSSILNIWKTILITVMIMSTPSTRARSVGDIPRATQVTDAPLTKEEERHYVKYGDVLRTVDGRTEILFPTKVATKNADYWVRVGEARHELKHWNIKQYFLGAGIALVAVGACFGSAIGVTAATGSQTAGLAVAIPTIIGIIIGIQYHSFKTMATETSYEKALELELKYKVETNDVLSKQPISMPAELLRMTPA